MEENKATETNAEAIAPQEDAEKKIAELEAERAKLLEESTNYKAAYLKEKAKDNGDDDEDGRMARIAQKVLAESRLAEIAREQDSIIKKALKENKELKLAQLNKTDVPVSTTSHSEGQSVKDTLVTPEQMAQFRSMGKTDKWIENYKRNLLKNTR